LNACQTVLHIKYFISKILGGFQLEPLYTIAGPQGMNENNGFGKKPMPSQSQILNYVEYTIQNIVDHILVFSLRSQFYRLHITQGKKMLNLLKKLAPKVAASLVVASTLFAQDSTVSNGNSCAPSCKPACPPKPCPKPCPQPKPPTQMCPADPCCPPWSTPVLNAAYNYPSRIETRCPWDLNFDVSYIFWQATQDDMDYGYINNGLSPVFNAKALNMDFEYKSGFKIGLGGNFDYDGWDMRAEYTWFHNSHHASKTAAADQYIFGQEVFYTQAKQTWNLDMDIAEVDFGRWYYVGTQLTFRPSFGARAAWIGQKKHVTFTNPSAFSITGYNQTFSTDPNVYNVHSKIRSWGLGLKAALESKWMFPSGFRLFGNAEGDLLMTKYTVLKEHQTTSNEAVGIKPLKFNGGNLYGVKPHLDLEFGLGWGTYIDCNSWYLDFALGYDFQVFFSQNMFRFLETTVVATPNSEFHAVINNVSGGNLYIQGLTFTTRLDF
jgi:hypothetical protein